MAARSELAELEALASSIASEVDSYREQRRRRTDELVTSRIAQAQAAPVRRRRRHRGVAAVLVAVLAAAGGLTVLFTGGSQRAAVTRSRPAPAATSTAEVVGRQAEQRLAKADRPATVLSCTEALARPTLGYAGLSPTDQRAALAACEVAAAG